MNLFNLKKSSMKVLKEAFAIKLSNKTNGLAYLVNSKSINLLIVT